MTPTTVDPTILVGYLTSSGRGVRIVVQARCTCGWAGPSRAWSADCLTAENEDLDRHSHVSRHQLLDQDGPAGPVHARCAHVHDRHDDCPVPYDSPAGLLFGKSKVVSGRDALAPGTGFAGVVPLGVSAPRGVGFGAELCGGCLGRRDAEGDGVSEGFELADEAACTSGFVDALVVVVGSEIGVGGGRVG